MAGGNAIASGAAILTTNADGFVAGLQKSEAAMGGWGKRVQASADKSAKGFRETSDKISGFFGVSLGGVVAMAMGEIGKRVLNSVTGLTAFQNRLGEMDNQIRQTADLMERAASARDKWLDVGTVTENADAMAKEIKRLKNLMSDEQVARSGAEAGLREIEDPFASGKGFLMWAGQRHGDLVDVKTKVMEAAGDRIATVQKKLLDLEERRAKLLDPDKDEQKQKMVQGMTDALEAQAAKWDMNAKEIAMYDAYAKGLSFKQMERFEKALDKSLEADKLKAMEEFSGAIEKQVTLFGESAAAAELYDLKMKGLGDEQLKWAEGILKMREEIEKAAAGMKPQLAGATLAGTGEAYRLIVANKLRAVDQDSTGAKKLLDEMKRSVKAELDIARFTRKSAERLAELGEF